MGQCSSLTSNNTSTVEHAFPPWCVLNPIITSQHVKHVQNSWSRLMNGDSKSYAEAHKIDCNLTPLTYFYNTFYGHLFDWYVGNITCL